LAYAVGRIQFPFIHASLWQIHGRLLHWTLDTVRSHYPVDRICRNGQHTSVYVDNDNDNENCR